MRVSSDLPAEWRGLPAHQRDILVTLVVDGPGSGNDLFERIGGVEGRSKPPTTYRNLGDLQDGGYVQAEEKDGRENIYKAAHKAVGLVDKVGRVISETP